MLVRAVRIVYLQESCGWYGDNIGELDFRGCRYLPTYRLDRMPAFGVEKRTNSVLLRLSHR